jgi:hypothetical protein
VPRLSPPVPTSKFCPHCEKDLDADCFYVKSSGGLQSWCKVCLRELRDARRHANSKQSRQAHCSHCAKPIPTGKIASTRYCNKICRDAKAKKLGVEKQQKLLESLEYRCHDCKSTFSPSHLNQKYCSECLPIRRQRQQANSLRKRLRNYNLSQEVFEDLWESQSGLCEICKSDLESGFSIDHDHSCCPSTVSCGTCVRGLLCMSCNVAIGLMQDNTTRFRRAIEYLERDKNGS